MAKQNESAPGSEKAQSRAERESEVQEEQVVAAPTPDASLYVVQPTSYQLPANVQARANVPDMRFTEEVLKDGDEDFGGEPVHPEENQPVMGIGPGDEVPDTTGRAANQVLKKSR